MAKDEETGAINDANAPLIDTHDDRRAAVNIALRLSLVANLLLFISKGYIYILSRSESVLASFADSAVDVGSQLVVFLCDWRMRKVDSRFPIGKTKLQTIGAIITACIMTLAAVEVIKSSVGKLVEGFGSDDPPIPDMDLLMYVVLGVVIVVKTVLFFVCNSLKEVSESAMVLAEDHRNDILSNSVAIAAAVISIHVKPKSFWWVDPAGGILISLYIIWSWLQLAKVQIDKIIGLGAPPDFVEKLKGIANSHDEELELDVVRAYHFGMKYFVELDVVVPGNMTVTDSHDVAVGLQMKIELLPNVERAFVHVDYQKREDPEHKVDWSRGSADFPSLAELK
ncbi:hypothetical protein BSKO_10095 [Bryopsis sp. KO-2023]|nr:hypothetical protein BSKO_10095 [Bryopsis sp. KO-2023]